MWDWAESLHTRLLLGSFPFFLRCLWLVGTWAGDQRVFKVRDGIPWVLVDAEGRWYSYLLTLSC